MNFGDGLRAQLARMQGEVILPTARTIYIALAGICLVVAALGLIAAIVLHLLSQVGAERKPLPDIPQPVSLSVNLDAIQQGFRPPDNIRAISFGYIPPVSTNTILAYLDADSAVGLAAYPSDFLILGGPDAALFNRSVYYANGHAHTALAPTPELVERINKQTGSSQYSIRIAAKDAAGAVSTPVLLRLTLNPQRQSTPSASVQAPMTSLEQLARRIAQFADPRHTPLYFSAYQRAQRIPAQCGASQDDANFLAEYAKAFDYMRKRMAPQRIEQFYGQFCMAWRTAANAQALTLQQAEAARDSVMAENMQAVSNAKVRDVLMRGLRNTILIAVAAAIGLFLCISLFLAFLAMENHSKAVREAVEALARLKSDTP